MAFSYGDMQQEVLRMAVRNQSGGLFTTAIQNAINLSMWTIARSAKWRSLRRKATFNTITTYFNGIASTMTIQGNYVYDSNGNLVYDSVGNPLYVTAQGQSPYPTGQGPATCTSGSNVFSVNGATFISDGIQLGRWIKFDGSVTYFKIASITSETTGTLNQVFDGPSGTTLGYAIMPQEEYTLPIQIGHSAFFWHRKYGMPKIMKYVTAYEFYQAGVLDILTNIPVAYRMWGMDAAIQQPISPSVMTIASNNSADQNIAVTVFGTVNGFPDYEIITTNGSNGTTLVNGAKIFSHIERITKNQNTLGIISINSNYQATRYTVSVNSIGNLPALGDVYSNNGINFTITYINVTGAVGAQIGVFTVTGSGAPTSSGTLTLVTSATGDPTIAFSSAVQQSVNVANLPAGFTTTGPMYTKVQVYPLPNWIFPIYCYYYKLPYQLVNPGDVPEIGEDFTQAIILLAVAKMKAEMNQAQDSANFMQLYTQEINSLKATNLDKIDWKVVLKERGDGDNDAFTGGLRFAQIGGSGQYGGSWNP